MSKIATVADVVAISGQSAGSYNTKKCTTLSVAQELGCELKTGYSYASNQLVPKDALQKKASTTFSFVLDYSSLDIIAYDYLYICRTKGAMQIFTTTKPRWIVSAFDPNILFEIISGKLTLTSGGTATVGTTIYIHGATPITSTGNAVASTPIGTFVIPSSSTTVNAVDIKLYKHYIPSMPPVYRWHLYIL